MHFNCKIIVSHSQGRTLKLMSQIYLLTWFSTLIDTRKYNYKAVNGHDLKRFFLDKKNYIVVLTYNVAMSENMFLSIIISIVDYKQAFC